MGRRSQHKPDELRSLIIDAAHRLATDGGVTQLSAREIARLIGYAPGTLYNMYENLDEILLRVEVRILEHLDAQLGQELSDATGAEAIRKLAASYVAFAHKQPRLWSLLTEHGLPPGTTPPTWYREALEAPIARFEKPVAAVLRSNDAKLIRQSARMLWCAIHGMTSMSVNAKLGWTDEDDAASQVNDVVDACLKQLAIRTPKRSSAQHGLEEPTAAPR